MFYGRFQSFSVSHTCHMFWFVHCYYQGRIQTENGSVQTLWAPKNMPLKMKKRTRKIELPCVLFKRTSYTAKKKWLKVCKIIQLNKVFLLLRNLTRPAVWNVVPKFLLDATMWAICQRKLIANHYHTNHNHENISMSK